MRIWVCAVLAIVLGSSIGLGLTRSEFHGVTEYFKPVSRKVAASVPASEKPKGPRAVVDNEGKFDFGTLDHGQEREKKFVVRNEGDGPLVISNFQPSCGQCIKSSFDNTTGVTVPPGGQTEIAVTYGTHKPGAQFSESATFTTNDPALLALKFEITGFVTMPIRIEPESLSLGAISSTEPTNVKLQLWGYKSDKLELLLPKFSNPATASFFEIAAKPMEAAAIKNKLHARAGLDIEMVVKAGLPIGPLNQSITFSASGETEHTLTVALTGNVSGDVTIVGRNYNPEHSTFSLGVVNPAKGKSAEFFLLIKGPHRNETKVTVGEVDPKEVLSVTIGKSIAQAEGRTIRIPVTVTVAKGSPRISRLGTSQGPFAKLVLETTHPQAKQLPINVRFVVE